MNILCKLFGHKPHEHTYSGAEYMRVTRGVIDGTGSEHARLDARCARCETVYRAGQIHLPARRAEFELRQRLESTLNVLHQRPISDD